MKTFLDRRSGARSTGVGVQWIGVQGVGGQWVGVQGVGGQEYRVGNKAV